LTNLQDILAAFVNCNLHFCIYGAFGTMFMVRAALCRSEQKVGEAREHFVHGVVYFSLGLMR
jgi:hypothetical protein